MAKHKVSNLDLDRRRAQRRHRRWRLLAVLVSGLLLMATALIVAGHYGRLPWSPSRPATLANPLNGAAAVAGAR